jgi:uncharacterized protein
VTDIQIVELPYHRLFRAQPTYRWWRPLVAVLLLVVFIVAAQLVIVVAVLITVFATGAVVITGTADAAALEDAVLTYFVPDAANPITLLIGLGSVAVWLPLVPLALRCAGIRPAGVATNIVHSVTFRLRWRWLAWCFAPAVLVVGLSFAVSIGVGLAAGEPLGAFTADPATYAISLALILLIVPFQAAAEEYVFRGMMFQAIGAWLRWIPVALVVTTVVFASLHIYEIWGLLDVASFGVAAILLTWRTGGLEAAIALHVVNNVVGLAAMGTGAFGPTAITPEGGSPVGLAITLVTMTLYVLVVFWRAPRHGVERLSRIGIPVAPVAPAPAG